MNSFFRHILLTFCAIVCFLSARADGNVTFEINTPLIVTAGEMFRVTTLPWNATAESEAEYYANDFFGRKAGLTVSAQLEGEMAAMGLGRIYTFGPTFRAENSNTTRHVAEFWHVEPEVCFCDIHDIIEIAEDFIKYIVKDVMDHCPEEMEFFNQWVEKGVIEKLNKMLSNDFVKLDYTDAIEILNDTLKNEDEENL